MKLILGSGNHQHKGYISFDLFNPQKGIRWDLRWSVPLHTNSVTAIHCEHFLEHLSYPDEALTFLKECKRVLDSQSTLRLIVPDGQKYITAYHNDESDFWESLKDLGGHPTAFNTKMEIVNQSFRMNGDHCYAYDYQTLQTLLSRAGFSSITLDNYSPKRELDLSDSWRINESLYLNAQPTS